MLYVPGYFFSLGLGFGRFSSFAIAPAISAGLVATWCIVLSKAHIFATPPRILVPVVALCVGVYALGRMRKRAGGVNLSDSNHEKSDFSFDEPSRFSVIAYALASVIIVTTFFLVNLDGAESFNQGFDNASHLSRIMVFVLSGDYSSIGCDFYWDCVGAAPFGASNGFYPSAWHDFAALLVASLGVSAPLAENALDCVLVAMVFPLSVLLFLGHILDRKDGDFVASSCCVPLAFSAFPWMLLKNVFPNIMGFSMVFCSAVLFMGLVSKRWGIAHAAKTCLALLVSLIGLGLSHPNTVFTLAVILIPYCAWLILGGGENGVESGSRIVRVGACVIFLIVVCSLWYVAYRLPMFQGVVSFGWASFESFEEGLLDIALVGYRQMPYQVVLAFLVVVGCVVALRNKRYRWVAFAFAVSAIMYLANATSDGTAKSILTGFWYNDSYRVSAMLAIFAVPIASIGIIRLCRLLWRCVCTRAAVGRRDLKKGVCVAAACVFFLMNYVPSLPSPRNDADAFKHVSDTIAWQNLTSRTDEYYLYTSDEKAFVHKVKDVVPESSIILNEPYDGSVYAYGADALNVYYRTFAEYGNSASESDTSAMIRERLPLIATSNEVRSAVEEVGAEYLLLLDIGHEDLSRLTMISYHEEAWRGMDGITDDTPGFEAVLSEGDMRLYRITALDE